MKCLIPITLATALCACGLTGSATRHAMAPRLGSPALGETSGLPSSAPGSTESRLFRVATDAETPASEPTSSGKPTTHTRPRLQDETKDDRLAQASPSWIDMGGALQVEDDAAAADEADGWEFFVRPYGWLPKITGSVTVNGNKSKLIITQGMITRNLKSAALVRFAAKKDDTFVALDTVGFAIADDGIGISGVPAGKINVRVELALIELDTGVFLYDDGEQSLAAFVGARYLYIYTRINPKNVGIQGQSASVDWVDPIIGTRYLVELPDKWELMLHADYGGFGVGSASDVTYQLITTVERQVTERLNLGLGYRYLVFDHSQGSGASKSAEYFRFSGPVVGLSYRF